MDLWVSRLYPPPPLSAQQARMLNVGWMLAHRLRRWPNIQPTLFQSLVPAGRVLNYSITCNKPIKPLHVPDHIRVQGEFLLISDRGWKTAQNLAIPNDSRSLLRRNSFRCCWLRTRFTCRDGCPIDDLSCTSRVLPHSHNAAPPAASDFFRHSVVIRGPVSVFVDGGR